MSPAVPHPVPTTYRFAEMFTMGTVSSHWRQTAEALPTASTATCESYAFPASFVSMGPAVPHPVPTTYRFAHTLGNGPLIWFQTAVALPLGSTATRGRAAESTSFVSMSSAVPQPVPTMYRRAQTLSRLPSHCCPTTAP